MEQALENLSAWDDLPDHRKAEVIGMNPEQVYYNMTLSYHAENRIRYKGFEYIEFYRDLIRHLRVKLEVFPYHLCRYLNFTSPFDYYTEILCDLLRTQKPYDCLPTFTAAEILRIVGIHRNSYMGLLEKCKEKGWASKISRAIRNLLPKSPLSISIEAWWTVFPLLNKKSRKTASKAEVECLHQIYKDFTCKSISYAGQYDREALENLYKATVVEFDIDMDGIQFELVRDTKSFINDKNGFGKQLGEVLRLCESYKDLASVCQNTQLKVDVVKDCLGILSKLGFLDVVIPVSNDWHRSWQPVSDDELSFGSLLPSIEASNSEDCIRITLAATRFSSQAILKAIRDYFIKWQVEIIESPRNAVALNSIGSEPVVFTNLSANEAPLYRLYKMKYCKSTPVVHITKGYTITLIPPILQNFAFFLVVTETGLKEVHKNELLSNLIEDLTVSSAFIIPLKHRYLNTVTIPLPLNVITIKDRALASYLRDLDLITHFEKFIGYIEIAVLTDKNYLFLNQYHGIPFNNKELALNIAACLVEAPWFKYNNLEVVAEAQQDEVFQYREFICDHEPLPEEVLIKCVY